MRPSLLNVFRQEKTSACKTWSRLKTIEIAIVIIMLRIKVIIVVIRTIVTGIVTAIVIVMAIAIVVVIVVVIVGVVVAVESDLPPSASLRRIADANLKSMGGVGKNPNVGVEIFCDHYSALYCCPFVWHGLSYYYYYYYCCCFLSS